MLSIQGSVYGENDITINIYGFYFLVFLLENNQYICDEHGYLFTNNNGFPDHMDIIKSRNNYACLRIIGVDSI